jgi:hypothetical protein
VIMEYSSGRKEYIKDRIRIGLAGKIKKSSA